MEHNGRLVGDGEARDDEARDDSDEGVMPSIPIPLVVDPQSNNNVKETHALVVLRYGGYWRWIPRTRRIKFECEKQKTFRYVLEKTHFQDLKDDIITAIPKHAGDHLKLSFAVPGTRIEGDFRSMIDICKGCWKIFIYMTTAKVSRRSASYFIPRRSSRVLRRTTEQKELEE